MDGNMDGGDEEEDVEDEEDGCEMDDNSKVFKVEMSGDEDEDGDSDQVLVS